MKITKKIIDMADKIIADGWREFISEHTIIELATREELTAYENGRFVPHRFVDWVPLAKFLHPNEKPQKNADLRDHGLVGKPGSAERIAEFQRLAAEEKLFFSLTDDDLADKLAGVLALLGQDRVDEILEKLDDGTP